MAHRHHPTAGTAPGDSLSKQVSTGQSRPGGAEAPAAVGQPALKGSSTAQARTALLVPARVSPSEMEPQQAAQRVRPKLCWC